MAGQSDMTKHEQAALDHIAKLDDASSLRTMMLNARAKGSTTVYQAAFRRIAELVPDETPGSLEHDFWKTTLAYEQLLTEKNGRTTRASRLRQKVARAGIVQTMEDLCTAKSQSEGFKLLVAQGMPELTAEWIVLAHSGSFSDRAVEAARARLEKAGIPVPVKKG
jgi:hypothetical protein